MGCCEDYIGCDYAATTDMTCAHLEGDLVRKVCDVCLPAAHNASILRTCWWQLLLLLLSGSKCQESD